MIQGCLVLQKHEMHKLRKCANKQNFQVPTVATIRFLSYTNSPLPQSSSTEVAAPMCLVQMDGAGGGEEGREGETEGCMDDPAKRIQVKVASCL